MTSSFDYKGEVEIERLQNALAEIVARHDALRTVFRWEDGELAFEILNGIRPTIIVTESDDLESSAIEHARTIFNLEEGPLLKLVVLRQGTRRGRLLLVVHHIVFDEWSLKIFWREFQRFYNSPRTSDKQPSAYQYSDFAFWQNDQLKQNAYEIQLEYWKSQLQGVPGILELPSVSPRIRSLSDNGAITHLQVDIETSNAIRKLARKNSISLSTALLAGFEILISRYSNTDDFVIGIPIANRRKAEFSDAIGFFLNTAAIRSNLKEDLSLTGALESTHRTVLAALENQDIPFDEVIEAVNPERLSGKLPLVQIMFVYQKDSEAKAKLSLDGVVLENVFSDTKSSKLDLTLFAVDTDHQIELFFEYKEELFDSETIERILDHYKNLLQSMTANIDGSLASLEIFSSSEKQTILERSIGERIPLADTSFLPEQIVEHSCSSPDLIAIETENDTITYSQLIQRANSLSSQLIAAGASRKRPIALYMDRSIDAIVTILGILRSGSHYLPLDPEYPINRTLSILKDAQPTAIVAQDKYRSVIEGNLDIPIISPKQAYESAQSIPSAPEQLAYIIYTSGSTGRSKGVAISHDNLRASTLARMHYYGAGPQRFLLLSSLSFDSSVAVIFWTLSSGGTLVLPKPGEEKDTVALCNMILNHAVSTLLCIPSLYREILNTQIDHLASLRTVIVAGESCPPLLPQKHFETVPDCALYNEYGPTETTVWCTVGRLEPEKAVTIGNPIPNYETYILNSKRQIQPNGVPGELFVSGLGLAKGYVNDDRLTDDRFISIEIAEGQKIRAYRTGDRARRLASGEIEFLGRIDGQIKILGVRLELGEIESALKCVSSISDAIVQPVVDSLSGETTVRLVGFLVVSPGFEVDQADLKAQLAKDLPRQAIPSQFVVLEKLPKLPNGKIDRKSLPIPDRNVAQGSNFVEATSATEAKLVEIWKEVLSLNRVSIHDNFFDLGGTSLQAIRLFTRIKRGFESNLSAGQLLQSPTISELANLVDGEKQSHSFKYIVPLNRGRGSLPIFLVHSGGLQVLFYKDLASYIDDTIPLYGIQPVGHDGLEKPLEDISEMASRYLSEVTLIHPNGPYILVGHCFGVTVALEMARILQKQGKKVPLVVSIDGETPLRLDHVPKAIEKVPLLKRSLGDKLYSSYRFLRSQLKPAKEQWILRYGAPDKRADLLIKRTGDGMRKAYHAYRASPYTSKVLAFHCLDSDKWVNHSKKDWLRVAPNMEMVEASCLHDEILVGENAKTTASVIMDTIASLGFYSPKLKRSAQEVSSEINSEPLNAKE